MSTHLSAALVRRVRQRAGEVCEYCRLPQSSQEAAFHADHIQPLAAGGATAEENLALACVTCSSKKAARTHARSPTARSAGVVIWIEQCRLSAEKSPLSAVDVLPPATDA